MLYAVIMAGGSGTRFWPESRRLRPKQLLTLDGRQSLIQATLERLAGLVPDERILVVTAESLAGPLAEQLPRLPPQAILAEPCRRDTAPCIGWAACEVLRHDPQATMLVLPADHVIRPIEAFQDCVRAAVALVDECPQRLLTFGIRPDRPAETFGYIQRGETLPARASAAPAAFKVLRFREKPKLETAREYLAGGDYLWNAGIFVWKARTILDELSLRQPEMHSRLQAIAAARGTAEFNDVLRREFAAIRPISIDYAVMEHAADVAVVEATFAWDDVGSWQSLARLRGADAQGNTIVGRHLGVDTSGTIVRGADDHLVATLGLKDCIVIHTPDATLVADKHDEESIRKLVKLLEERGWTQYL